MNRRFAGVAIACSGVLLFGMSALTVPEPARAQFGLVIPHIGGIPFGIDRGGRRGGGGGGGRHNDGNNFSDDSSSRQSRDDRPVSLAPPSSKVQNNLLHVVASLNPESLGGGRGDDGTSKSVSSFTKVVSKERERDWTEGVQKIIKTFTDNQDKRVTTAGDVTEHAIEQSLDNAIKASKVDTFESFLGENWTTERLRSMVLDLVSADLDSLFKGNSRGYAPMQELDQRILHSAQATYRRIFELSESWPPIAARRCSCNAFIRRMGPCQRRPAGRRHRHDYADGERGRQQIQVALRQNENGYALRYRAERIVFDCLSDNVKNLVVRNRYRREGRDRETDRRHRQGRVRRMDRQSVRYGYPCAQ